MKFENWVYEITVKQAILKAKCSIGESTGLVILLFIQFSVRSLTALTTPLWKYLEFAKTWHYILLHFLD